MKKIFSLLLILICAKSFCQFPNNQNVSSPAFKVNYFGGLQTQKGLINGRYADTTAANSDVIDFYCGAQIYTFNDGYIWVRDTLPVRWSKLAKYTDIVNGETGTDKWISDWRRNNYQLSSAIDLTYHDENKQTVTLSNHLSLLHGFVFAKDKLWASDMSSPNNLIRFNDPDDLTDYDSLQIGVDGNFQDGYDVIYIHSKDKLYVVTNDQGNTGFSYIYEVDPVSFTKTLRVTYNAAFFEFTSLATDETYLYALVGSGTILKINLSTWSFTTHSISSASNAHSIRYDGTYLYVTDVGNQRAWQVRPSDMTTLNTTDFGASGFTDDFCFAGDNLWCGLETTSGNLFVINKITWTSTTVSTGISAICFGTYFDGKYVWAVFNTSPGTIVRVNPETREIYKFTLSSGENTPSELITDGQRLFITAYIIPSKIIRLTAPTLTYVSTNGVAPFSLTTTGNSGSSTYSPSTGILNVPTYTLTGLGGFANPMTTLGDIIIGGSSGTPTRLGIGSALQLLRTNAGATAPEWFTPTYLSSVPTLQQVMTAGNTTTVSYSSTSTIITTSVLGHVLNADNGTVRAGLSKTSGNGSGYLELVNGSSPDFTAQLYTASLSDNRVFYLQNTGRASDTLATLYDVRNGGSGTPTLQEVVNAGNTVSDAAIQINGGSGGYIGFDQGADGTSMEGDENYLKLADIADGNGVTFDWTDITGGTSKTIKFPNFTSGDYFTTIGVSNSWSDGIKQTFNPNGTNAGINVGSQAGDPSTLSNGDIWYNSSTGKFRGQQNGSTVDLIGSGSGTPGGSDTYVQFNDGGSFGGHTGLRYDKTNIRLGIGGAPSYPFHVNVTGGGTVGKFEMVDNDHVDFKNFSIYYNGGLYILGSGTPGNTTIIRQEQGDVQIATATSGNVKISPVGTDATTFTSTKVTDLVMYQSTGGFSTTSYQTITSGSSSTVANTTTNVIFDPASDLGTYTLTLPASPTDGQIITIRFGGTVAVNDAVVSTLTISPNTGQSIYGVYTLTQGYGGDWAQYEYKTSNTTWYRKIN